MKSITSTLPPELLSHIFSYMSDSRDDIAACRLVCDAFRELTHPILGGLERRVLAEVFQRIPKLCNIRYTDYRSLAKWNESYDDCCQPFFGDTLEPCDVGPDDSLTEILEDLAVFAPDSRIQTIILGGHPFSDCHSHKFTAPTINYMGTDPVYLEVAGLHYIHQAFNASLHRVLGGLRRLRLALNVVSDDEGVLEFASVMATLLSSAVHSLAHLTLDIEATEHETVMGPSDPERAAHPFERTLALLDFPRLQSLDLRHWYLPQAALSACLSAHKSTLRELRFIGCMLGGMNSADMAKWGGQHLQLSGVELSPNDGGRLHKCGSPELIPNHAGELYWPDEGQFQQRLLGCEMYAHQESAWLAGRPNLIKREVEMLESGEILLERRLVPSYLVFRSRTCGERYRNGGY
ncbi:hypothetical protein LTR85_000681 [Meristemomyces frigidus]|nr:hypothetical protein LTR85_000681 [Meristemomyces frigidus]